MAVQSTVAWSVPQSPESWNQKMTFQNDSQQQSTMCTWSKKWPIWTWKWALLKGNSSSKPSFSCSILVRVFRGVIMQVCWKKLPDLFSVTHILTQSSDSCTIKKNSQLFGLSFSAADQQLYSWKANWHRGNSLPHSRWQNTSSSPIFGGPNLTKMSTEKCSDPKSKKVTMLK